jgi:hypothetical protein
MLLCGGVIFAPNNSGNFNIVGPQTEPLLCSANRSFLFYARANCEYGRPTASNNCQNIRYENRLLAIHDLFITV